MLIVKLCPYFFKFYLFFIIFFTKIIFLLGSYSVFFIYNLFIIIISIFFIISVLISVAFFTLLERKKLASFQRRKGPNVEGGLTGFLQPIADGIKLVFKEVVLPNNSFSFIFILSPLVAFVLGFAS